jgi:2-keto-3-deoxy-L-rhamnonate aldolase RhmA
MTATAHPINTAKRNMLEGQPAIGTSCGMGAPLIAELLSHAGFDFVLVDLQHGAWTDETAAHAFRAISLGGAMPMARVAANDYGAIGRLLDRGALGIVVPMVNTREQAQAAAFAVRYPPQGGRSTGGNPAYYGAHYDKWINDEVFLAVQIETVQAVENAEAILGVDGVDGCWIGPSDLAKSMGIDRGTPEGAQAHREMIMRVVAACQKTRKIAGISGDLDITFWLEQGLRFVTASYDGGLMLEGARKVFDILGKQS